VGIQPQTYTFHIITKQFVDGNLGLNKNRFYKTCSTIINR